MLERPWIQWWFSRDLYRRVGWRLGLILFPGPPEIQRAGHLCKAFINLEIYVCLNPPQLSVDLYTPDRLSDG